MFLESPGHRINTFDGGEGSYFTVLGVILSMGIYSAREIFVILGIKSRGRAHMYKGCLWANFLAHLFVSIAPPFL